MTQEDRTEQLQRVLSDYSIAAIITLVQPRPAVTSYFVELTGASRVNRVVALRQYIARLMSAPTAYVAQLDECRVRIDV